MNVLAIETSCDETGIALLEASGGLRTPKFKVLKNVVSSQIPIHRPFGGVVPNIAKREHLKALPILWEQVMSDERRGKKRRGKQAKDPATEFMAGVDLITVTVGPGLEPALWTGIEFAKELAKKYKKPLIGANHLEGHLYSFLLPEMRGKEKSKMDSRLRGNDRKKLFPAIALIVSGGHTILLGVDSFSKWKHLGETRDDAAGEAFDKVARMLELPYPGGPEVEKLAREGNPNAIAFPRPMIGDKNFDFSFSGLKTSVLYYLRDHAKADDSSSPVYPAKFVFERSGVKGKLGGVSSADVAASFQAAAINVLVHKTIRAAEARGANSIILCGGVAANSALRNALASAAEKIGCSFRVPAFTYNLDNAAMIAAAGYMAHLRKKKYPLKANGTLGI